MLNDEHILSLTVSNLHNGIRLVDSEALACITSFCFPSSAASVQCLAWVPSAPGMFITGGKDLYIAGGYVYDLASLLPGRFYCYRLDLPFNLQPSSQLVYGTSCCTCLCSDTSYRHIHTCQNWYMEIREIFQCPALG